MARAGFGPLPFSWIDRKNRPTLNARLCVGVNSPVFGVEFYVFVPQHHLKIFYSIIKRVVIFVVNLFVWQEWSAQVHFHDMSVRPHLLAVYCYQPGAGEFTQCHGLPPLLLSPKA
jgi:hypothetical protein